MYCLATKGHFHYAAIQLCIINLLQGQSFGSDKYSRYYKTKEIPKISLSCSIFLNLNKNIFQS